MRCLIVEDEEMAVKVLENHLQHLPDLELVGVCHNAMDALAVLQKENIDLLFLDIQMPKLSGLGLLRTVRSLPAVVITTAYRDYAIEGFELDVADYLLKPIGFERFLQAVHKVSRLRGHEQTNTTGPNTNTNPDPPFLYIKHQRAHVKILLDDIIYMESIKNHIRLVTTEATYLPLLSITELAKRLSPQRFLRIHRSFVVALQHVQSFTATYVVVGKKTLPIGRMYKQEVMEQLERYVV